LWSRDSEDEASKKSIFCPWPELVAFATRNFIFPQIICNVIEDQNNNRQSLTSIKEVKKSSSVKKQPLKRLDLKKDLQITVQNHNGEFKAQIGNAFIHKDPEEASRWYRSAQTPSALYNLAVCHELGLTTGGEDLKKAFKYYKEAAKKHHPAATYNLALFYFYGRGVVQENDTIGEFYLREAASLGVTKAQTHLLSLQSESKIQTSSSVQNISDDDDGGSIKSARIESPTLRASASSPNIRDEALKSVRNERMCLDDNMLGLHYTTRILPLITV
jgi:hypothetical protein